jgi:hypothetical protein
MKKTRFENPQNKHKIREKVLSYDIETTDNLKAYLK